MRFRHLLQLNCKRMKYVIVLFDFVTGDPACGDGITRHYFTDLASYVNRGFPVDIVTGGERY